MSAYFDWAATTRPNPEILELANKIAVSVYANPSSVHSDGKKAAQTLEQARTDCARILGTSPSTLYFTSGGTESDYVPLLALLQRPVRGSVAISAIEHPAIAEQAKMLSHTGWETLVIPADRDGFVSPEAVLSTIREDTAYVAVMAVNNETGAIQPVEQIAEALVQSCKGRKKPHFHVDAVQAIGKIPVSFTSTGIDSGAISGHKIGGPRGIGLLYLARRIEPFIRGGGQESGIRPGTENVPGAVALAAALDAAIYGLDIDHGMKMMDMIIERLGSLGGFTTIPESRTLSDSRFSPWIIQLSNSSIPGEVLVRSLSAYDISISTGSACSSRKKSRPVLDAMRVPKNIQQNAFRLSIGPTTDESDIEQLYHALKEICRRL